MQNQQLTDYVKQQISQGVGLDVIRTNLITHGGWIPSEVDQVFSQINQSVGVPSNPNIPHAATTTQANNPVVTTTAVVQPVAIIKYAGFWIRWCAYVVDALILSIPVGLIQFFTPQAFHYPISLLVSWLYFVWLTNSKGATLGKMLLGLTVISTDGQRLSFGKILLRETIGKLISGIIFGIGYIMVAFTEKKQGLHDLMAKSVVVYKDPSKKNHAGLIIGIIIAALLPIIAIVGILASIVLVSLNSARNKGEDAHIISDVQQLRTAFEYGFDSSNSSYPDLGNDKILTSGPDAAAISQLLSEANLRGMINVVTSGSPVTSYAIYGKATNGYSQGYFCVDSTGKFNQTAPANSTVTCP